MSFLKKIALYCLTSIILYSALLLNAMEPDEAKKEFLNLESEAKVKPTREMLKSAISNDQPFLVKTLINELPVSLEDLRLAENLNSKQIGRLLLERVILQLLVARGLTSAKVLPDKLAKIVVDLIV